MEKQTKQRGRPKKITESSKGRTEDFESSNVGSTPTSVAPIIQTVEVIVEKIVEIPEKRITGFALYKNLKDARYPQGGMGRFVEDPNGLEKVYIPRPEEIYTQFIADPEGWNALTDALARAWIELSIKK